MFDTKNFLVKFALMLTKVNKKIVLGSLLVVGLVLFGTVSAEEPNGLEVAKEEVTVIRQPKKVEISKIELMKPKLNSKVFELRQDFVERKDEKVAKKDSKKELKTVANIKRKTVRNVNVVGDDYEALLRIVEAEATGEDFEGKRLIANVVLNRVESKEFPNSVQEVVYQKIGDMSQFSPLDDGRYYSVKISNMTRKAVESALAGDDKSRGALFFVAKSMTSRRAYSWFDNNLKFLFKHGVHSFYKY